MPEDKFTIVYKRAPDYRIYPGDVIYGGPTPDGEGIMMNVCVDHTAFPSYIQHPIENGKVRADVIVDQAMVGNLERELLCGVSLSLQQAKRTIEWLKQMVSKIEKGEGNE